MATATALNTTKTAVAQAIRASKCHLPAGWPQAVERNRRSGRRDQAFGMRAYGAHLERSKAEVETHGGVECRKQVAWQASSNRPDPLDRD